MAVLYVTEFSTPTFTPGPATFPALPSNAAQTVSITAGSVASSAFNANTTLVRLATDAICSVAFGTAPTASATTQRMAAGQTEYFHVPQGQSYKVAVITNT